MIFLLYQTLLFFAKYAIIVELYWSTGYRKAENMINIVHYESDYNDERKITAVRVKLKYIVKGEEDVLPRHALVATVSASFFDTTLLTDVGESVEISPNPKRGDIINLKIKIEKDKNLSFEDIGRFLGALQTSLDNIKLF